MSSEILCGWDPARKTLLRSLRLRPGGEHSDPELAVEVRQEHHLELAVEVRRRKEGGRRKEEGGVGQADIKSSNPHLTCGEVGIWNHSTSKKIDNKNHRIVGKFDQLILLLSFSCICFVAIQFIVKLQSRKIMKVWELHRLDLDLIYPGTPSWEWTNRWWEPACCQASCPMYPQ